ncbi:hypothetical protein BC834DRAFT_913588 [Gloeopeniophorella convolvens]|nr:hypothetical protein BC834DRAFT_913588 [Gloeopeniophorella convolvens]
MNDAASISRATSVSRASRQGSTVSRSQSLIKKNIAPHDLRPSDVLIDRFVAWKAIVKQLIAYFEGIADIENNTAKEMTKLGAVIQVPFRSANQFLGEGGLQDVYYGIRDKTRIIADQHANLGRTIDSSIVQHLQKLRVEIKAHIKNVQNDTGKLATSVAKERELSARYVAQLSTDISTFKNTPLQVSAKTDPFVANMAVVRQLHKQVNEENALQKSIIIMQQNSAHFEEGIVRAIQSAWQTFDEWQSRMSASVQETWRTLGEHMASIPPDHEWISFSARSDHLLDPETPLRNPEAIHYPSKEDPSVIAVHTGYLERKKRFTRTYRESYFVLTPAGFLHEYSSPTRRTLGPVAAAVRAVGYASEEEEGDEEDEGSSVEEEQHAADGVEEEEHHSGGRVLPGGFRDADEETEPPSYRHPHGSGELAQGYTNDAKKVRSTPSPEGGADVSRRPSQRQQEKAPEGRAPHGVTGTDGGADDAAPADDDAGAGGSAGAGGEDSRFHESL